MAKKTSKKIAKSTKAASRPARSKETAKKSGLKVPSAPKVKRTVRLVEAPRVKETATEEAAPVVANGQELSDAELRKCKSGLTKKDLGHYRQVLLEKRAELLGDVESLQVDAQNNGGNLSNLPLHMADVGSDNYQQEFTLGLMESERKMLREIDEALARIERGIYGVCISSGKPIGRARLDAKPGAKYCIEVVRERERRGLPA